MELDKVFVTCFILLQLQVNNSESNIYGNCQPNIDWNSWHVASPPNNTYRLIQSHIFSRHGDRVLIPQYVVSIN